LALVHWLRAALTQGLVQGGAIDEALRLSRDQVDSILLRLLLCREQLDKGAAIVRSDRTPPYGGP